MPRDGSNLYSLPANTLAVSGEVISSTKFNTLVQDLETDMNTDRPVVAGGTGASTAAGARTNLGLAKAVETKSAGYTADGDDRNKLLFFDTTATLSLTAAATLGSDWAVTVLADSGVTITVDPDGAETVNGSATAAVAAGEHATIFCTGTAFHMLVGADDMTGAEIKALYEAEADTNAYTDAEQTKVGHISVTQAVDLDQMETDIAALANGMVYKGDWDASAGTFPGSGAAQTGWFYYVSVAGTVDSVDFAVGDNIVGTTDNASTGTYAANWSKHDQTDAVQAVAGLTGSITASALRTAINVEDGATADQSAAEILTALKTVDGAGCGFDADLLDGNEASAFATASDLVGQQTIWIPAGAMEPRVTTAPATSNVVEIGTSLIALRTMDFATDADDHAGFAIQMPKGWDEGTLTVQFVWSTDGSQTAGLDGVYWGIRAGAYASDDVLTAALGSVAGCTSCQNHSGTTDDIHITGETTALTVAGSPGAEEWVYFEVLRDVSNGCDDLDIDARLHGVKIHYTTDALTDD